MAVCWDHESMGFIYIFLVAFNACTQNKLEPKVESHLYIICVHWKAKNTLWYIFIYFVNPCGINMSIYLCIEGSLITLWILIVKATPTTMDQSSWLLQIISLLATLGFTCTKIRCGDDNSHCNLSNAHNLSHSISGSKRSRSIATVMNRNPKHYNDQSVKSFSKNKCLLWLLPNSVQLHAIEKKSTL